MMLYLIVSLLFPSRLIPRPTHLGAVLAEDAEEVPETSLRDVSYDDSDDLTPRAELAIAVKMAEEMEAAEAGAK